MALDFPDRPAIGDAHRGGVPAFIYEWDGRVWKRGKGLQPPRLDFLIPPAAMSGDPPITVTAIGTRFLPDSVIVWDGTPAPTTYVSDTELTTEVDLNHAVGEVPVTVDVNGTLIAPALAFMFSAQPPPMLTAIAPTTGVQGQAPITIALTGTLFRADSEVYVDNILVPFTFVSETSITGVTLTAPPKGNSKITSAVRVANDGASSSVITFTWGRITVTDVSPSIGLMNEPLTLTVTGSNFTDGDEIVVAGVAWPTTVVSSTQLTAEVTPPYLTVQNPPVLSQPAMVNVTNSASPNLSMTLTETRFTIRSMYPDFFSNFVPLEYDVEIWGWGPLTDGYSVAYIYDEAAATQVVLNGVGTEFIIKFDIEPLRPAGDEWVTVRVLNGGKHWSTNSWSYYCDMDIG